MATEDDLLTEAQREVDALLPGTEPIAPPVTPSPLSSQWQASETTLPPRDYALPEGYEVSPPEVRLARMGFRYSLPTHSWVHPNGTEVAVEELPPFGLTVALERAGWEAAHARDERWIERWAAPGVDKP